MLIRINPGPCRSGALCVVTKWHVPDFLLGIAPCPLSKTGHMAGHFAATFTHNHLI